jgi:hypothetical protein
MAAYLQMVAFDVSQQQINQIRRFSSNPSNTTFSYSSCAHARALTLHRATLRAPLAKM